MNLCEQLKQGYLKSLEELTNNHKDNFLRLKQENSDDEAILEKIKINVFEIFFTVFNTSLRLVSNNPKLKDLNDEDKLKELYNTYIGFFEKLPSPWKEKASRNKEFGFMEEYYKEQIKIETADSIKQLFLQHYERIGN